MKDPIVEEVRRYRHEHEQRFGFNLDAIFEDILKHQAASGRPLVRLSSKMLADRKGLSPVARQEQNK